MMARYLKWLRFGIFQLLYGLAIFVVTRDIYTRQSAEPPLPARVETTARLPAATSDGGNFALDRTERLTTMGGQEAAVDEKEDYREVARMADEQFQEKNYARAAALYEKVLSNAPDNVDIYNNLGLTLHYINRSTEALEQLERGIAIDQNHQRIWLTLGFVQSQIGNIEAAKRALRRAKEIDSSSRVGVEAARMLDALP